jgi:hypothetical protein
MTGRSRLSTILFELARVRVETTAELRHAELLMSELAASRSIDAIPVLLPFLVAPAWPPEAPSTLEAHRLSLTAAATRALESILAHHGARATLSIDLRLRGRSGWGLTDLDLDRGWATLTRGWPTWARFGAPDHWRRWLDVKAHEVATLEATSASPLTTLAMLAGHPSGHVREQAVLRLRAHGAPALRWLLVRALDWVAVVRAAAARSLAALTADSTLALELVTLLPLMERLRELSRVDARPLLAELIARLAREPHVVIERGLVHADREVRRATLELLDTLGGLRSEHLELALRDRDVGLRLRAARRITAEPSTEASRLRAMLVADRAGRIRARGLELVCEAEPDRARALLERTLADDSRAVRQRASYLARESHLDARAHYVALLDAGAITRGAVLGLGETGTPDDWERLVPALDASASVARAAIASMRALNASATRELRLVMVDDARPSVSQEAARGVGRGRGGPARLPRVAARARASGRRVPRRAAVGLASAPAPLGPRRARPPPVRGARDRALRRASMAALGAPERRRGASCARAPRQRRDRSEAARVGAAIARARHATRVNAR